MSADLDLPTDLPSREHAPRGGHATHADAELGQAGSAADGADMPEPLPYAQAVAEVDLRDRAVSEAANPQYPSGDRVAEVDLRDRAASSTAEFELLQSRFAADLPVSGAWQPGDPVGDRRFVTVTGSRPFALEWGGRLPEVRVAYETWGELDAEASNAVLVCHALTGDSHAAGDSGPSHPTGGWWRQMIGPGKAIDTDRYFVVCSNVIGGCQGSTGPADVNPGDGRRWGARFPVVTVRDMVRAQARLAEHLGIARWSTVAGGSMGGMQALEWALMYPRRVRSILPLATSAAASALQIAWSAVGRLAIAGDPNFCGGDYYDNEQGPWQGLAVARQLAQVTYRSGESLERRFGREMFDPRSQFDLWGRFQVESYLDHHGQKLVRRFDANSYLVLNRSMDLHDVGRGRGGTRTALGRVRVPTLTASIRSDRLYPPHEQHELREAILAAGGDCRHVMLDSDEGHDGFLIEHEMLTDPIASFLTEVSNARQR